MNCETSVRPVILKPPKPSPCEAANTSPCMTIPIASINGKVSAGCIERKLNFLAKVSTAHHSDVNSYVCLNFGFHLFEAQ